MIELDVIGLLFDPPIVEGSEPVPLAGWHVNTTPAGLAARPELSVYVVTPNHLRRVWAGDDPEAPEWTVALRFPDQEMADSVLFPTP